MTKTLILWLAALPCMAFEPAAIVVRCGNLLDVRRGELLPSQAILIAAGRIVETGPGASIATPSDATEIDLRQGTCLPGLIDAHVHLTSNPDYSGYRSLGLSIPRVTLFGAKNAKSTLRAGFTSVRNVGAAGYSDVALRDAVEAGDIEGPRMLVSGPALGITGGHCDDNLLAPQFHHSGEGVADGPWAARAKVRENVKYGADLIKICASGGVLSKGDSPGTPQYSLEEITAIVEEAHKLGRKVAAHAHGGQSIKDAIRAGVDSVEHASLIDDEGIALARQHGTFLVFDIYNDDFILQHGAESGMLPESIEKERQVGKVQRANFRHALLGGARMAFGTDAGVYPHGDNAKQFALMTEYGMTPIAAIRSATIEAAMLLGWEKQVGVLDKHYYTDLIAVQGNPLADVRALESVKFVMKDGRVVRNDWGK